MIERKVFLAIYEEDDNYLSENAFDSPKNQVGLLKPDGTMELDRAKHNYWVGKIEAANLDNCRQCAIAPSCLGITCQNSCVNYENQIFCPEFLYQFDSIIV